MEIKKRYTGDVIYKDDSDTMKLTVTNAVNKGIDLRGSDLRGSDLSGSDLSGSVGLKYAQMSFSGFGECNRLITLADIDRNGIPTFFRGCFIGTNEELIEYIENGDEELKESRHFARKTLLEAIKFSNK